MRMAVEIRTHKTNLFKIWKVIKSNRTFFVTGHVHPDGDTVGSELALLNLLSRLGKKVIAANTDPVPAGLSFLPNVKRIRAVSKMPGVYDAAIILECSTPERMGGIINLKSQIKNCVINIDHHLQGDKFGDINLIDPKASSISELIYYLFKCGGLEPTQDEATSLYAGLVTDTGRFQFSNTTAQSHLVAAGLINYGVEVAKVNELLFNIRDLGFLKTLGKALETITLALEKKMALITIKNPGNTAEFDEIVNYGLMIPSVSVVALLRPGDKKNDVKISLRSKDNINVSSVAKHFGGGGHRNASGCNITGTFEQARKRILQSVKSVVC